MSLRKLTVTEAVRGSIDQAHHAVARRCGQALGKRRLEELVVAAAVDVDDFYRARIPLPCSQDMPLVLQVDGKGVVMRPEALRARPPAVPPRKPPSRAARPGRETQPREDGHRGLRLRHPPRPQTPPRRDPPAWMPQRRAPGPPGPRAESKWCTASLVRPPEQVIADAFDQAQARDPKHLRPCVVLVDGARHQLDLITTEAARRGVTVHVLLDFVHVAEYVWAVPTPSTNPVPPKPEPGPPTT